MSENYIKSHFGDIKAYENIIEHRLYDDFTMEDALRENAYYLEKCRQYNINPLVIDEKYDVNIEM